jgi:hypothetical protein
MGGRNHFERAFAMRLSKGIAVTGIFDASFASGSIDPRRFPAWRYLETETRCNDELIPRFDASAALSICLSGGQDHQYTCHQNRGESESAPATRFSHHGVCLFDFAADWAHAV